MIAAFRRWIKDSETIAWARLQMLFGVILAVIPTLDPYHVSAVLPANWAPYWLLASGIITELARRNRAKSLGEKPKELE